ncbi:MAG TPA: hypothetical protein VK508_18885 [Cyclobacteriaceae bacterium]|nr:hypothetical protein [Cyclobacteriaceae bacterium]
MRRGLYFLVAFLITINTGFSQGFGVPSKKGGIGFGNLPTFTGVRFNFKDRDVEKINGLNVTIWQTKNDSDQTGTVNGISFGLPMAMGHENQNGISVGVFGVAATKNLSGINIGVLGAGAGHNMTGLNVGGLGIGTGQDLRGINIGGLGAGAGGDVVGVNLGGLGIGAGGSLSGFSFGGLGVGSGGNVNGIALAGVGIGAGEDLTGFSFALVGIGAGQRIRGINIAGVGIGAGEEMVGINVAGVGVGSPKVKGLAIALAVGGVEVTGIMIAPAFFRVGGGENRDEDGVVSSEDGVMKGLSISAYNRIKGEQRGVALGVVNYTKRIKGVQFGLINIVRDNPRGLRVLPIFNTRFGKGS